MLRQEQQKQQQKKPLTKQHSQTQFFSNSKNQHKHAEDDNISRASFQDTRMKNSENFGMMDTKKFLKTDIKEYLKTD